MPKWGLSEIGCSKVYINLWMTSFKKSGHTEWMNTAKLTLRRKDASFFGNLTPVSALQDVCLRNVRLSSQLSSSDSCLTTLVRGLVTIFGTSELSRQIIHNGTATSTATTPHQVNHSGSRSACRSVQGSPDYYSIASGLIVFDQLIRIQFNLCWVYFENMTILKKRIWKQWLDASTWQ